MDEAQQIRESLLSLNELSLKTNEGLGRFAELTNGSYIPPTKSEQEYRDTIQLSQRGFVRIHEESKSGIIRATSSIEANKPSNWGYIKYPKNLKKEWGEETETVFRGCIVTPNQKQIAGLARIQGISTEDINNYFQGIVSIDEIITRADDETDKTHLGWALDEVRRNMKASNISEIEALKRYHTALPPGPNLSLWVSVASNPGDIHHLTTSNEIYGPINGTLELNAALILRVPKSQIDNFSKDESGIRTEIDPDYIAAIIPATGPIESVRHKITRIKESLLVNL